MASTFLTIQADPAQLAELRAKLNGKEFAQAMFQALTRTQRAGVVDLAKAAQKIINLRAATVKEAIFAPKPAKGSESAMIRISDKPQKLVAFIGGRQNKVGVSVQMRKDQPRIVIPFAFKATVASAAQKERDISHTGFFRRVKGAATRSKGGKAGMGVLTPKGIAPRLPIKELFGPSVLKLFFKGEITELAEQQGRNLQGVLAKNFESQLDRFLNAKKGTA